MKTIKTLLTILGAVVLLFVIIPLASLLIGVSALTAKLLGDLLIWALVIVGTIVIIGFIKSLIDKKKK